MVWSSSCATRCGFRVPSDGVEEQIGCTAAEGLADPAAVLAQIKPTHAERLAEAMAIPPGSETAVELTWHHRDGRPVHSRTWARCRQRPDGSVVLDGVTRDITQLREVEAELQTFQDRYRLLAENAWEVVVWTASPNGAITYISPSVERVRGFTPAEAMSQSIEQTHPPATAAGVVDFYRRSSRPSRPAPSCRCSVASRSTTARTARSWWARSR